MSLLQRFLLPEMGKIIQVFVAKQFFNRRVLLHELPAIHVWGKIAPLLKVVYDADSEDVHDLLQHIIRNYLDSRLVVDWLYGSSGCLYLLWETSHGLTGNCSAWSLTLPTWAGILVTCEIRPAMDLDVVGHTSCHPKCLHRICENILTMILSDFRW